MESKVSSTNSLYLPHRFSDLVLEQDCFAIKTRLQEVQDYKHLICPLFKLQSQAVVADFFVKKAKQGNIFLLTKRKDKALVWTFLLNELYSGISSSTE
jgi:hypothetical protein